MKPEKSIRLTIHESIAGNTLSQILHETAKISHSIARAIIFDGLVKINNETATDPARRLRTSDRLEARFDPQHRYRQSGRRRRGEGFRIVLEDPDLIIVDKDPGLLTVPTPTHKQALTQRLLAMYKARGYRQPRIWVVHRIDRYTSGLVLFGRSEQATVHLMRQFRERLALREYIALCEGVPSPPHGCLSSNMILETPDRKVRTTRHTDTRAKQAVCHYRTEQKLRNAALVRVTLETGRRNQIRVQFAEIGHALIGDRTYGERSDRINRVALHAARLGFEHPQTRQAMDITCPLPADMQQALTSLRGR